MSVTITAGVILLQLAAGYRNATRQSRLAEKAASAQREFEEQATLRGIASAREEYSTLCRLQQELETAMQQDRILQIKESLHSHIDLRAYSESLLNFPLLVPPFVMKNESLPWLAAPRAGGKVAMHCILTNCTDTQFNAKIFPELEERLGGFFCKHWNIGSPHAVLFYQGGWKDTTKDARPYISNLKSELGTLPTLVISPVLTESDGIQFLFSCWGMGAGEEFADNSIFVPQGLGFAYRPGHSYSEEDKARVLAELVPALEAFIGFFADMYYWLYYGTPPLLPALAGEETDLKISDIELMSQYEWLLESIGPDSIIFNAHPERIIWLIQSLPNLHDKKGKCLETWRKRYLKEEVTASDPDKVLMDARLYSSQDIPFLKALTAIFPEYDKGITDLCDTLGSRSVPCVRGISVDQKYNRPTRGSMALEEKRTEGPAIPRKSKYDF